MHKKPQSEKLADLIALAGRTMHQIDLLRVKLARAGAFPKAEIGSTDVAYCQISGIRHALAMQQIAAKQAEHEAYMVDCHARNATAA